MTRRMRRVGGTPIEEAPLWALAILAVVLWLVVFPALVGLLDGVGVAPEGGPGVAAAAALVSLLLVGGLAVQKPWPRPAGPDAPGKAPPFARFSTWFYTTLVVPNFLFGMLVLFRNGEALGYLGAWVIGAMVSLIHGGFALARRYRRRRS